MKVLTTIIPVFNGAKYIALTLRSVAAQSRRPDRSFVLDNCSTDGTREIVGEFREMPCELVRNDRNLGLFGNLNRSLEFAPQTEYLHLLHADDVIHSDFYQCGLSQMESVSGRAMTYCQTELIDENGSVLSSPRVSLTRKPRPIPVRRFVAVQSELRNFYFPCVLLKTARQPSPCRFDGAIPQLADQLFWAEWAMHSRQIVELPQILCQFRIHSESGTTHNTSSLQNWVLDEWKVMTMIAQLLGERGIRRGLRTQKLKCLFAARSQVKIEQLTETAPEFAREIKRATREIVNPCHWFLGALARTLRGMLGSRLRERVD